MTDDTQWTDWIEHDGVHCPIPDAKAGGYEIKYVDGGTFAPTNMDAVDCEWDTSKRKDGYSITHYREAIK